MPTPTRPLPDEIEHWIARARRLRWADAACAWLILWGVLEGIQEAGSTGWTAALGLAIVGLASMIRPLRVAWRPVSAAVGLVMSRGLRPGHRAWYVRSERADLVLVTARRGVRLTIATPEIDADEVLSVRRTRVLLLPADRGPDS